MLYYLCYCNNSKTELQMARNLKIRDLTLRDGQQSSFATRMNQEQIDRCLPFYKDANFYAMEVWGGAVPDSVMRYLNENPWTRLETIYKAVGSVSKLTALSRGRNLFGYSPYTDEIIDGFCRNSIESGLGIMRIFDALNDVRNAVMDQGALWELANAMYIKGDLRRSYRYINFASDCAARFGTRLRYLQITPVIANVDKMWQMRGRRENAWLKTVIAVSAGFLVIVLSLLFYLMRQRRRLTQTKSELSRKNEQLLTLNSEMKQTLTDLDTANRRLVAAGDRLNEAVANLDESNRVKEKYIGLFLRQCSSYIDRMDSMRREQLALIKGKRYAELYDMVKTHDFRDKDQEELFEIFDSTFIRLFPTFVDEFNQLLRPESRIVLPDQSKLTTGVRIFALIRLGIDDSSKIAEFLHYSVNTIYNYRAKIKNGAAVGRDEFEDLVKAIGSPKPYRGG